MAFTWTPGRAFCKPLTMTLSPGFNPSLMSHLSPIACAATTLRASTWLFVNHHHHCVAARRSGYALLGDKDGIGLDAFINAGANKHTGKQTVLRVREHRPERDRAGAFIYGNVGKLQRAFTGRPDHFPLPVEPCYWRCLYAGYLVRRIA